MRGPVEPRHAAGTFGVGGEKPAGEGQPAPTRESVTREEPGTARGAPKPAPDEGPGLDETTVEAYDEPGRQTAPDAPGADEHP